MTRQTRGILALVLICFGLLTLAGWSQSGAFKDYKQDLEYYNRKCDAERKTEEGDYKKDCQRILYRAVDDPVAIFTLILTLATVGLFAATYFLWRATRDLVRGADKTAERQLRAYVGIERIFLNHLTLDTPITLRVVIKNYGQTPAYRECANLAPIGLPPETANFIVNVTNPDTYPTTLMPGEISHMTMPFEGMDKMFFNDILRRGEIIWIAGSIDYTDAFGRRRSTKVRMFAPRGSVEFLSMPNDEEAT